MTAQVKCPSAQAGQGGNMVIGVAGTKDSSARVSLLPEPVPLQAVAHLVPDTIPVTEVLRLAGPCAGEKCAHFRNERCTLASRIVARLPTVIDHLSKCAIRPSCRWWHQEGPAACFRCPAIVTEPFEVSDLTWEVARPPTQNRKQEYLAMPDNKLNPQPLPPGAKVDLGELTEAVTTAVRTALESRPATANTPLVFRNPHIIIGIIIDPTLGGVSAAE